MGVGDEQARRQAAVRPDSPNALGIRSTRIPRRMGGMITVANRIYVRPEYHEAFEARFRDRARLVDGMPGFISNQVLRPVNEGDPFVVFTLWASRADFLNWVRSDAFQKGHAQSGSLPREAFDKPNVLEMHEVVQDSSRPDLEPEPPGGPFSIH
jgi:heme oxygenase (mycobilin-producing)